MKKAIKQKSDKLKLTDKNVVIEHEKKDEVRLNKYISSSGHCSRREADRLIEAGLVTIDDVVALVGSKVSANQQVKVNDHIINNKQNLVYIALNKPSGITCTTDTSISDNISDFMDYNERIFPIGRLDKQSTGLIILTNDGDVVNKVLRSSYNHEKEYIVSVDHDIDDDFIERMSYGVRIFNPVTNKHQMTKDCQIKKIDECTFSIILTEGLNRQIRRMCTELGYNVISLKRIRVMNIQLNGLKNGEWRYLDDEELSILNKSINK